MRAGPAGNRFQTPADQHPAPADCVPSTISPSRPKVVEGTGERDAIGRQRTSQF